MYIDENFHLLLVMYYFVANVYIWGGPIREYIRKRNISALRVN